MRTHLVARLLHWCALGAVFTALFACSSEDVNEPMELQPLTVQVPVDRLWSSSAGDGDEELALELVPVLDNGVLYSIDRFGLLRAFEPREGDRLWQRDLNEQVSAGLGHDKQHLYYATFQGDLVCLDRTNGNEIWRRRLSSEATAAPVSNGSRVVVQTIDGQVFAFDVAEGIKIWQNDIADPILTLRGTARPLLVRDAVYVGFGNGEVKAFNLRDGRLRWKAAVGIAQGRTELERLIDIDGQPLVIDDQLYALAYQGNLVSLDVRNGAERWRKTASSFKAIAHANDRLIASLDEGIVAAFSLESGSELWRNEQLKYRRLSKATIMGNFALIADFEGFVHVISIADGQIKGRFKPDSDGVMEHMITAGPRLFLLTRSGDLMAYTIGQTARKVLPRFQSADSRHEDF